jgi:hypothetical protein
MVSYLLDRKVRVEEVNTICLRLFDAWCETRSVTPLVYLMHCWPMSDSCAGAMRRLRETMVDLRRYHPDTLDVYTEATLSELGDCLDELIDRPEVPARLSLAS